MTLRVAITRAAPEAEATAARVRELGAEPVLAPLLHIEPRAFDPNLAGVQALLFSSSNGVRGFAATSADRALPILAVGNATAEAARLAGFLQIHSADGDVGALAGLARAVLDPQTGILLHISGVHAAGDLVGELSRAGFSTARRIAYEARAATVLPAAFAAPLDVVLFHSARAAATFLALSGPNTARLTAACFSPRVAEVAARASWARLIVATEPREGEFLRAALTM